MNRLLVLITSLAIVASSASAQRLNPTDDGYVYSPGEWNTPGISPDTLLGVALPFCWQTDAPVELEKSEINSKSKKLGAKIKAWTRHRVVASSVIDVNVVTASSKELAKLRDALAAKFGSNVVALTGDRLLYFETDDPELLGKTRQLFGFGDETVKIWRVTGSVIPVYRGEDAQWATLSSAVRRVMNYPDDEDAVFQALALSANFQFKNELHIRMSRPEWGTPEYKFTPEPTSIKQDRDVLIVMWDELPRYANVPVVTFEATVPTKGFASYTPPEVPNIHMNIKSTTPWRVQHTALREPLANFWDNTWPAWKKYNELLCWQTWGIAAAEEKGTRTTVMEGARSGLAQNWGKSDLFVCYNRAFEQCARQVWGVVAGKGPYVWSQVYLRDDFKHFPARGQWISADQSRNWFGVSADYVPLFICDNGHPPFIWLEDPKLELLTQYQQQASN